MEDKDREHDEANALRFAASHSIKRNKSDTEFRTGEQIADEEGPRA
jgi:hypothetical protein